jgi:hypothetical protein
VTTCNRCEGLGQSFTPCDRCGGDGRERETKRIQLTVPAGEAATGTAMQLLVSASVLILNSCCDQVHAAEIVEKRATQGSTRSSSRLFKYTVMSRQWRAARHWHSCHTRLQVLGCLPNHCDVIRGGIMIWLLTQRLLFLATCITSCRHRQRRAAACARPAQAGTVCLTL